MFDRNMSCTVAEPCNQSCIGSLYEVVSVEAEGRVSVCPLTLPSLKIPVFKT